jgi:hypothetical protein
MSLARLFERELLGVTLHTSLLMAALLFLYNSITYGYPTHLGQLHRQFLPFMVAFNSGAIAGAIRLSETRLGRRGAKGEDTRRLVSRLGTRAGSPLDEDYFTDMPAPMMISRVRGLPGTRSCGDPGSRSWNRTSNVKATCRLMNHRAPPP